MLGITLLTPLITGITGYPVTTGATQKKDNWFFNSQSETVSCDGGSDLGLMV